MDASKDLPPAASPAGELVVQGGRMDGARRALGDPLTLLGSSAGCDIRLSVDSIAPIQCAIVLDAAGAVLRDLAGGLTHVNGLPAKMRRLGDGDLIDLGPFQFRLDLRAPRTDEVGNAAVAASALDLEGLRVQAAAVAAQQAALDETEARLDARAAALEKQEAQLAAHLESRQKDLDADEEKVRAALSAQAREKAVLDARRKKLSVLRKRLSARSKRQTAQATADARRREAEAASAKQRYEREQGRLLAWHEKAAGDIELQKRQLKDEWQELALDQQRWEEALNAEKADRARREADGKRQAAELLSGREALAADR
ncbi:MAG: hypothetical protein K2W96_25935, partial [Gemmataceae bacterium]|nr:hypothetical protein [Gemmataceae bacterium]